MTLEDLAAKLDGLIAKVSAPAPKFLSINAAAEYCSISPESIRHLVSAGKLTPLHPVPGRVVISREELEALVLSSDSRPRKGRAFDESYRKFQSRFRC